MAAEGKIVSLFVLEQRPHGWRGDDCGDEYPFKATVDENFMPLDGEAAADENAFDVRADEDRVKLSFDGPTYDHHKKT